MSENNNKIKASTGKAKQGQKLSKFVEGMREKMPKNKQDDLDEELNKKRNKDRIKDQIKILEEKINDFENAHPEKTTKELSQDHEDYNKMVKELENLRKGQEKPPKEEKAESGGDSGVEKPKT